MLIHMGFIKAPSKCCKSRISFKLPSGELACKVDLSGQALVQGTMPMGVGLTWVPKSYVTIHSKSICVIPTVDSMEAVETHLKTQGP